MTDDTDIVPEARATVAQRHKARKVPIQRRAQATSKNGSSLSPTLSTSKVSDTVRDFANGLKLAIEESREELIDIVVEAHQIIEGLRKGPQIAYNRRQHKMKIILEMSSFVAGFAVATTLVFFGMALSAANQLQLGMPIALGYIALCIGLCYFAAREYFKWSHLYIVRNGGTLRAVRPKNDFFFLAEVNRYLNLRTVVGAKESAPWIMRSFGISRIVMQLQETSSTNTEEDDKSDDKDDVDDWRELPWTADGPQLIKALIQGSGRS